MWASSSLQKKFWFVRYYSLAEELWRQIPLVMKTTIILAVAVMIVLLCIRVYQTPGQQPTVHVHQVAQHSIAIYHSENLYTEPPSEKYRYSSLQLYPIFASSFFPYIPSTSGSLSVSPGSPGSKGDCHHGADRQRRSKHSAVCHTGTRQRAR